MFYLDLLCPDPSLGFFSKILEAYGYYSWFNNFIEYLQVLFLMKMTKPLIARVGGKLNGFES
jgi:hypothetical protein